MKPQKQKKLVSIGEVARRLGVSVDVARSLVDKGELPAARTAGRHRLVHPEDLERLETAWASRRRQPNDARRGGGEAPRPSSSRSHLNDDDPDEDADFEFREAIAAAQAGTREAAAGADRHRLEELKRTGARIAQFSGMPPEWHAKVIEQLERCITRERVPPWLSEFEAQSIVRGCVDKVVGEYREAAAQQREKEQARKDVDSLITYGKRYAGTRTITWEEPERSRACREAERALRDEMRRGWSEADARDLVDDVLDEFEEGNDDDEELE